MNDTVVDRSDPEWQVFVDRKVAYEVERTWPTVDGFLSVSVANDRWGGPVVHALLPVAFLRPEEVTSAERDRMAAALTKTYKREFRKMWGERAKALAERHADAIMARRQQAASGRRSNDG